MSKRLLTIKEASEYLGITVNGLYHMVYRREIPFVKIKGRIRFDLNDIDEWIERNKVRDFSSLLEEKIGI